MDKSMKFWSKYGYIFHLVAGIGLFVGGNIWLGVTNIFLAIPLFISGLRIKK